jgi:ATP-dependent Clp protease ATP-binding subunit ClpA
MLRLTKEARHAFTCAQAEARRTAVDPAGELGPSDVDALRAIGIDLDEIRQRVEASFGPGALTRSVQGRRRARLADRAKEVWSASVRETRRLGHGFLGSEHLLLGLNDVEACAGAQILRQAGVTRQSLRARVLEEHRRAS